MKAPSSVLLLGQTEVYKEYTREGNLLDDMENIPKSKCPEDILINDHSCVWASYYDRKSGKWGYACCRQLDKRSVCVGGNLNLRPIGGDKGGSEVAKVVVDNVLVKEEKKKEPEKELVKPVKTKKEKKRKKESSSEDSDSESDEKKRKHKKHKHKKKKHRKSA